ncbi:hypothetical protein ACJMK2_002266 [Sinanodonta woodiana]|uniref:UDENN domain-containing protein n=1 Tax=Sinanodonta woodiana TaxID=1069815 RepID=A0ABD3XWK2_SINWO
MEEDNLPQPLPQRLVEVMLVVGFDEDTGLPNRPGKESQINNSLDNILKNDHEPYVLAAVSSSTMVYFYPFVRRDETYPPSKTCAQKREVRASSKFHKFSKSFRSSHYFKSTKGQELPVSDEVIRSLSALCFPDGAKVYSERPENYVHFLVLTDMTGTETYSSCLTFYRPYIVDKDEQGNLYFSLENSPATLESGQARCYIPNCVLLISKHPYYTVFKDCLSSLTARIEKDQKDMYTFIKEYAHILTWTPVPPAGDVAIELNLCQLNLTLNPPDHFEKPVIDFPMHLTFLCFPIEEVLRIITCILVEERLLFLTTNYALLTVVMEIEGLVLVDIDTGMVKINPDENGKVKNIPMMPLEPANVFKSKCKQILMQFTMMDLNRPFIYNMEELRQRYATKIRQCNSAIASSCLELMVNLFRDVIFDTRVEHRRFNRDSFLGRKIDSEKEFFERVSKSDMFKVFLQDRYNVKSDYWSDLEMRTRKEAGVDQKSIAKPALGKLCRRPSSFTLFSQIALPRNEFIKFKLPGVEKAHQYVKNSLEALNKAIKECPDYGQRATFQYLRGLFHIANGDKIAALDDLINLPAATLSVHHTLLLHDIYQKLTDKEKQKISEKRNYEQLNDILKKFDMHKAPHAKSNQGTDHIFNLDKELEFEEFAKGVSELEMSNDYDTTDRLFAALTLLKRHSLDPVTFQSCYAIWESNQQINSQGVMLEHLEENETILKVSEVIKTDYGIGRIGLTDKSQLKCIANHEELEKAVLHLAYYTGYKNKGHHILPKDTVDALQHRLDPNMGERERRTVQALLYTPGDDSVQPRLWCGLSDGRVKVYNGINWILESENVQTKNCVLCLTAVGKKHVWAGSHGIFIIDTETVTCNKTLMDHPDQVVGIVLTEDGKKAFVAYVSGTILKWDVLTLTVEQPLINHNINLLSLKIYNEQLWLGTRESIIVEDMNGSKLQEFKYEEKNRFLEFDYFIKPKDKELWVGCRREGRLLIWDLEAGEYKSEKIPNTNGICCMIKVGKEVWLGTKVGTICIYDIETKKPCRELKAHTDTVRVICSAQDRYIISGAGSKDGRIALWSASVNTIDSGSYPDQ